MTDEQREGSRASLGILATGALVVGGIIGTGIFAVPAAVAKFGWVAYPAFVVVTAGSILLAVTFAELAREDPRGGGPPTRMRSGPSGRSPDFCRRGGTGSKDGRGRRRSLSRAPVT
jgi:hypothetical protein